MNAVVNKPYLVGECLAFKQVGGQGVAGITYLN